MGEMAIADGITHVIGTPHANQNYTFSPGLVRQRREELRALFRGTPGPGQRLRFPFEL